MIRFLGITLLLFFLPFTQIIGQEDDRSIVTKFEISYGLGGNFYLNYLENNPKTSLSAFVGKRLPNNSSFGLRLGVDLQEDQFLIPITGQFWHSWNRHGLQAYLGYALGWNHQVEDEADFDFSGGLALGAGYEIRFITIADVNFYLTATYDHRNTSLTFLPTSSSDEIISRSKYHFISFGLACSL